MRQLADNQILNMILYGVFQNQAGIPCDRKHLMGDNGRFEQDGLPVTLKKNMKQCLSLAPGLIELDRACKVAPIVCPLGQITLLDSPGKFHSGFEQKKKMALCDSYSKRVCV